MPAQPALLCPFRKYHRNSGTKPTEAWSDEFGPCLQDQCAMNRAAQIPIQGEMKWMNYCGLAGKP